MPSASEPRAIRQRQRMSVDERRSLIAERGGELVARYGSYGVSLQTVADAVGLTLPGLMHHVSSRDELLALIVEVAFDAPGAFQLDAPDASRGSRLYLPEFLRSIVERNSERPELVALFIRLAVEAHDPANPAHEYYVARHAATLSRFTSSDWMLPPRFDDQGAFLDLVRTALSALDGVQLQSLTDPAEDLGALWARVDRVLFGAPEWDGFRGASE